jgi:hypothetical protein
LTEVRAQCFKYAVINTIDALRDLYTWQHMYLAGRMHKPIEVLSDTAACKCIQQAMLFNRIAAVTAAALMQQEQQFTAHQLLRTIVSLSYMGKFSISEPVEGLEGACQPMSIDVNWSIAREAQFRHTAVFSSSDIICFVTSPWEDYLLHLSTMLL